ncbi:MAG: KEOPS complex subunit Pcc1 [Candidatus Bathyarchaeia archaeon]
MCRETPKSETNIVIDYISEEIAKSILESISPDNIDSPEGIIIEAETDKGSLKVRILCNGLGELVGTLDDLLSCVQAAEEAIKEVSRKR